MRTNRDAALAYVLKSEGGYAERPEEGGGAVNRGITFTVFAAWRKLKGKPLPPIRASYQELKAMTAAEAGDIYFAQFAAPIQFDALPIGVDYAVLDAAVQSGTAGGAKFLQEALGVMVDGHIGLATLAAVKAWKPADLINKLMDVREARERRMKNWAKFSAGWIKRNAQVRKRALDMAGGK